MVPIDGGVIAVGGPRSNPIQIKAASLLPTFIESISRQERCVDMRARFLLSATLLVAAGCGGGVDDPFTRVPVKGTVKVGGQPVAHGLLRLEGAKQEDLAANLVLTVTDGMVDSEAAGLSGITAGECQVELHLYEDADGAVPKGTWRGIVTVPADGSEISIDAPAESVEKAPRVT